MTYYYLFKATLKNPFEKHHSPFNKYLLAEFG